MSKIKNEEAITLITLTITIIIIIILAAVSIRAVFQSQFIDLATQRYIKLC